MEKYSRTIIVADNDELVRAMLRSALTVFGYNVITASDGDELLRLYEKFKPEIACIILSEALPRTSGAVSATKIRASNKSLPMILTTSNRLESRSIFSSDRALAYLSKPFDLDLILATIDTMIERTKRQVA